MKNILSKSDFLKYTQCPKYFWLWKNKPEIFDENLIDDFQQQIIEQGMEVEIWAQKLFPKGVLVESKTQQAVTDTRKFLEKGDKEIFQATFQVEGLYAMVDVLSWNEESQFWIINEVKGTTSKDVKKEEHYNDACFQKIVLERAGYTVGQVNLIELNKEFRKDGDIVPSMLLKSTDITSEIQELESNVNIQIDDAFRYMQKTEEPRVCDCVYKSRSNQCPCFQYCHPEVPKYSVHDISRIGLSKKKLREIIDNDWLKIEDVPLDFELSTNQTNHVHTTITGSAIIKEVQIREELLKIEYPIYFLDYETYPSAVPVFDGCYPFQQVPFQYSLHILQEPNGELEHTEYLHTDNSSPIKPIAQKLREDIGDTGSVIVWNQKFEKKCNQDLAELNPELADFLHGLNERVYDLMEIFSKQLYVHKDFRGSASIKYVLPVIVPELSYENLNVQNGGIACKTWKEMMFDKEDQNKKNQMSQDLRDYCKLDTFAMVRLWEELFKI